MLERQPDRRADFWSAFEEPREPARPFAPVAGAPLRPGGPQAVFRRTRRSEETAVVCWAGCPGPPIPRSGTSGTRRDRKLRTLAEEAFERLLWPPVTIPQGALESGIEKSKVTGPRSRTPVLRYPPRPGRPQKHLPRAGPQVECLNHRPLKVKELSMRNVPDPDGVSKPT